jgi:hypothetical protein
VELFLNFCWFALVAGAITALLRTRHRGEKANRLLLALGALLCAAALLFPAISITDDLHFDAFAIEDSNATKRLVNAIAQNAPLAAIECFGIVCFNFLLILRQPAWCFRNIGPNAYKTPLLMSPAFGRAPPATSLA